MIAPYFRLAHLPTFPAHPWSVLARRAYAFIAPRWPPCAGSDPGLVDIEADAAAR